MNVMERAKNIILSPAKEWEVIKAETVSTGEMIGGYAAVLAAIPAIAGFIGRSLVGISILGYHTRIPIARGIIWAILFYLLSLVGVYILALIIDALAPSFGAQKNMNSSLKVAVFSMTASWIAGVFSILPVLSILSLLGLYSLYLLYGGLKVIKEPPADKLTGYFIITLVVAIVVYVIIAVVVGAIVLGGYTVGGGLSIS